MAFLTTDAVHLPSRSASTYTAIVVVLDSVPVPVDEVLAEYFEGDVLVCHPAGPRVAVMNATGADVWVLIDGQRTVRDIAGVIAADYGIAQSRCESDVAAFVDTLLTRSLIDLLPNRSGPDDRPR